MSTFYTVVLVYAALLGKPGLGGTGDYCFVSEFLMAAVDTQKRSLVAEAPHSSAARELLRCHDSNPRRLEASIVHDS